MQCPKKSKSSQAGDKVVIQCHCLFTSEFTCILSICMKPQLLLSMETQYTFKSYLNEGLFCCLTCLQQWNKISIHAQDCLCTLGSARPSSPNRSQNLKSKRFWLTQCHDSCTYLNCLADLQWTYLTSNLKKK